MTVLGMTPNNYILFAILLSFAVYAVILDKCGFVLRDEEGNETRVIHQILQSGLAFAALYGRVGYVFIGLFSG